MDTLRKLLGTDRVSTRIIDRLAFAHDASFYRLVPQAVVRPSTHEHVQHILQWCNQTSTSCTFRTGGTSISGQAVTDGIIVDLSREWQRVSIAPDASTVTMQPGITGARVNAMLHKYGRKIGPDPASIIAAMIGGIVANNASGMCCGTSQNSYHTLDSMQYMLATGTMIDTADADADDVLRRCEPQIHSGLQALRDEVRSNTELVSTIRRKYRIKNTIGYSLNAFLDEDQPARILARLLVGSEGTLGFIASVTLRTVPDAATKYTGLIIYPTLDDACNDVAVWRQAGAAAVEIMDDASLRSFAHLETTPERYRIDAVGVAALLVEFHDCEPPVHIVRDVEWTSDPAQQRILWKLRKGLMPTVGAMRKAGQTMINEDIAVPPEHLASLVRDVQAAFVEFDYPDGLIFGHAKDGNIHFIMNQSFAEPTEVDRYARFMDRIAKIVVDKYQGSLKAEHGTGRNMSPFVAHEWGEGAFAIMQRVKQLLDPHNILNRDVLINTDTHAHISNLKPVPSFAGAEEATTNLCIECGFCEHVCPTRSHSLTPRQRIVLQREMVMTDDLALRREIERDYQDDGVNSCAVDSYCSVVCPVGIDTGAMVKRQRARKRTMLRPLAEVSARNMHIVRSLVRVMLTLGAVRLARGSKYLSGFTVPRKITSTQHLEAKPEVLYVPTCVSTWVTSGDGPSLQQSVVNLARKSGIALQVLSSSNGCCGQPHSSQGFADAAEHTMSILLQDIQSALGGRSIPVLIDTSTCASAIVKKAQEQGITIIDQVGYAELVLQRVAVSPSDIPLVLHPGCGVAKFGTTERFESVARKVSSHVIQPTSAACCGMGGMHGVLHPDIVQKALEHERDEVQSGIVNTTSAIGITCNSLCEGALQSTNGIKFTALLQVLDQAV